MLKVLCKEALDETKAYAKERGVEEKLERQLKYLDEFAGRDNTVCELTKDFSDHSFHFVLYKKNEDGDLTRWFNGGLIYYKPGDTGVSGPQYSVRLGETDENWTINT